MKEKELNTEVNKLMEKYNWLVTDSAHEKYPMRIIEGSLVCSDGTSFYIPPDRIQHNGLGEVGSIHLSEERLRPLPDKILMTWFSYAENKFFDVNASLPIERLTDTFSKGMKSEENGSEIPCDRINIGIWPQGKISVYVCADRIVKEIFFCKAAETDFPWAGFFDNEVISRNDYITGVLKDALNKSDLEILNTKGVPINLAEKYRKTYLWRPFVLSTANVTSCYSVYFNGEHDYFRSIISDEADDNVGVLPYKHIIKWAGSVSTNFISFIEYNDKELYESFDKLISIRPKDPNKLQIEINKQSRSIRIFAINSKNFIELNKCTINTFVVN